MNEIIRSVQIEDPSQGKTKKDGFFDLHIEDGKIKGFEKTSQVLKENQNTVIVPGLVDLHTHLREPGFEYKETIETGSAAAAAGGFTTILCMANTKPVNDNPYVTQYIRSQAEKFSKVRVEIVGALSKGLKGEQLAEIGKMREAGIVAVSDDGIPVMNSYLMRKALDYCKAFDLPIISHAEDANLVGQGVMHEGYHSNCLGLRGIPSESEEILVARDIALARLTGGRVHFAHISTWQAIEHIRRAKEEGLNITCEVTPHHLMFTHEDVREYDSNYKMAPPLRTQKDTEVLLTALADGTIDCIATDHAPHAPRDKDVLFEYAANGVVGLETAWSVGALLVEQGKISLKRLVELLSTTPSRIMKLGSGSLKPGSNADFTLIDLAAKWTPDKTRLHSKSKNSPFIGKELKTEILATYVGGKKI
ncbi:MAG: dihydroorotase [Bacteriovoracia bacterium]